ncbi:hypothetical protein D2V07_06730 [Aurantiacibacter zhengii]|uniref:Transposase n=1 Tax=Aurantiacibacter zhengii TaxID=2307003 RepID=A0A418NVE8_9SPHN|nr:hypothetical protein D2V07_06730 [Aurantiacibacter zhengii]
MPQDTRGMPSVDDRRVLSEIVHVLKSGDRRSDCPEHICGPKKAPYNSFRRWVERIFSSLAGVKGGACQPVHR